MTFDFGGPSFEETRTTATHEAGHMAIALLLFPERVRSVTIECGWIERADGRQEAYAGLNHIAVPFDTEIEQFSDDDWRDLLALAFGGFLAEELIIGKDSYNSLSDLNTAGGIAAVLRSRRPLPVRGALARIRAWFWDPNPEWDLALNRAKQLLAENKALVEAIADALVAERTLDRDRLLALSARYRAST